MKVIKNNAKLHTNLQNRCNKKKLLNSFNTVFKGPLTLENSFERMPKGERMLKECFK